MSLASVSLFLLRDLGRDDVGRVGASLSLLPVELCEFDRDFSPFADAGVLGLVDRRVRLSTGMFWSFVKLLKRRLQRLSI